MEQKARLRDGRLQRCVRYTFLAGSLLIFLLIGARFGPDHYTREVFTASECPVDHLSFDSSVCDGVRMSSPSHFWAKRIDFVNHRFSKFSVYARLLGGESAVLEAQILGQSGGSRFEDPLSSVVLRTLRNNESGFLIAWRENRADATGSESVVVVARMVEPVVDFDVEFSVLVENGEFVAWKSILNLGFFLVVALTFSWHFLAAPSDVWVKWLLVAGLFFNDPLTGFGYYHEGGLVTVNKIASIELRIVGLCILFAFWLSLFVGSPHCCSRIVRAGLVFSLLTAATVMFTWRELSVIGEVARGLVGGVKIFLLSFLALYWVGITVGAAKRGGRLRVVSWVVASAVIVGLLLEVLRPSSATRGIVSEFLWLHGLVNVYVVGMAVGEEGSWELAPASFAKINSSNRKSEEIEMHVVPTSPQNDAIRRIMGLD